MSQDIIEIPKYEIGVMRDPNAVLAEARLAAKALMTVVSQKPKPFIMNGEQYLKFEDWQTVAKFYGLTAKVVKTTFIDLGGVKGFEATAEVIRLTDGMSISSADAMCLNDEDKWSTRSKYEWVDKKKVKTGDVAVPLFQLRSMAQTRACAKALRNVLAWVVVLAGFKPSVAEEMTGDEFNNSPKGKPDVDMPKEKARTYVDIITLSQGKKGDVMDVSGYAMSVSHKQYLNKNDSTKKVDVAAYTIGDLPKDPTVQTTIKVFGTALDIGAGQPIKFHEVTIGEYQNKSDFIAKEVICG